MSVANLEGAPLGARRDWNRCPACDALVDVETPCFDGSDYECGRCGLVVVATSFTSGAWALCVEDEGAERLLQERDRQRSMIAVRDEYMAELKAEVARLNGLVNAPELHDFSKGVVLEAAHQRERWGAPHVHVALEEYRQKMGIDAKLIGVAMVANRWSIADPNDPRQLDVVGFDTSVPAVMSALIGGDGMK